VQPGDHIQVLMKYDDGWALGLNLSSGQHPPPKGCFPFDCLGQVVAPGTAAPPSSSAANNNNNNNGGGSQLPMPVPVALQPGTPTFSVSSPSQTQSDLVADTSKPKSIPAPLQLNANPVSVDPASVPLPPPTPSSTHATSPTSTSSNEAPQLAPLGLAAGSPLSADFPHAGGDNNNKNQNKNVQGMKRASSLIASRDADLFVALGEVLDGQQQQQQQRPNEAGPSLI
jgi:hypothetical protein